MKQIKGFWLPDRETRIAELLDTSEPGHPRYQQNKLLGALAYCEKRGQAIDVGAHVGLWSLQLGMLFDEVAAFEPDPEKHECFGRNLQECPVSGDVWLQKIGLSDRAGFAGLTHKTGTSLKTHVNPHGGGIELRTLDSFNLTPDFIKIDVEGFELSVIRGALDTIVNHRPVIIVEQKPGVASKRYGFEDQAALRLLEEFGYGVVAEYNGDFVLVHPNA